MEKITIREEIQDSTVIFKAKLKKIKLALPTPQT
jgi:hypothetical protein